ncbi:hypothetical protein CEXT_807421 [Caerostris extrusa]|uniref:Uncharacterized protein n=1 Tax=Caerostris extrusa TaxID=172846 RepID=A0AAV4MYY6_CAEEX|nr:hypothetical protein CEXT_807421 [Caerostris extrusa]
MNSTHRYRLSLYASYCVSCTLLKINSTTFHWLLSCIELASTITVALTSKNGGRETRKEKYKNLQTWKKWILPLNPSH